MFSQELTAEKLSYYSEKTKSEFPEKLLLSTGEKEETIWAPIKNKAAVTATTAAG